MEQEIQERIKTLVNQRNETIALINQESARLQQLNGAIAICEDLLKPKIVKDEVVNG